jgi:hypothetical protein
VIFQLIFHPSSFEIPCSIFDIQKKQLLAASYTLKGGLPDRACQLGRESPGAILAKSGQFCRTMPTISPAPFR